jgi:putative membrane protein
MADLYLWAKTLHILAVIAWMAALLYLPRLMVYHAGVPAGSPTSETFKVMERRLLKGIATPSMIATWFFGVWVALEAGFFSSGWLHAKLALVLVLSGMHGYLAGAVRKFAADRNTVSARTWRFLNEVPAVLLIFIVGLVVFKPF